MVYIWWILLFNARTAAFALAPAAGRAYTNSAIYLSALWLLYPIAWGLCDGGNVISPESEMIFYGILDVLAKPVFCAFHAIALRNVAYDMYQLQSGKASTGPGTLTSLTGNLNRNGGVTDVNGANGTSTAVGRPQADITPRT